MREINCGLPTGWCLANLTDVAEVNPPHLSNTPADEDRVSFVPMGAVEELTGRLDASGRRPWAHVKKGYTRFQDGDVLFAKITPCMENGKVALANGLLGGVGAGSTEFHVVRPGYALNPKFLMFSFLQEHVRQSARGRMTGTAGQLRVPTSFLEEHSIPLAPMAEQQRIVEAVESQLSRLEDAAAALERSRCNLKRCRVAVLKAAVEGRLVPTEAGLARAEGRDYEPAEILLKRILLERRRRWEEAPPPAGSNSADLRDKSGHRRQYEDPEHPDISRLPSLPEGWCWATLPQLGELSRGKSKHRPRNDPRLLGGPYPFIQTGEVRKADAFIKDYTATYSEFGLAQSRLWPAGTLCITIAANIAETGILTFDACFPDSVVGFTSAGGPTLTRWVELFLRTEREKLETLAPATAQKNINLDALSLIAVAIPPAAEQTRIVAEIDRLLSLDHDLLSICTSSEGRIGRLRQAILKWAFEGKLVDQDPSDEPASALLERIRTETAAATSRAPGGRVGGKRRGDRGRMSGQGTEEARR